MALKLYRGNLVFTVSKDAFTLVPGGYVAVEDGRVAEVAPIFPEKYRAAELIDFGDRLLLPGFTDLHLHAAQYPNMGLGYDCELLPWIEKYTYPVENRAANLDYARKIYGALLRDLWKNGVTRAVVMGPADAASCDLLMELYLKSGLSCYCGKRHADHPFNKFPCESTADSLEAARALLEKYRDRSPLVKYMLNPGFAPGCSNELLCAVGRLAAETGAPVHSHLDENRSEVALVKQRFPRDETYADVYLRRGLFGQTPTVMAHCIHTTDRERSLLRRHGVYAAHCIHSNLDLQSGVMPLRRYLDEGIRVGLGSDIAGGHTLNMLDTMRAAVAAAKMRSVYCGEAPVTLSEVFYLATKGGGSFFGKVGSFEPGYEFDCLVVDDASLEDFTERTLLERVERFVYRGDDRNIVRRFVSGRDVPEPRDL